MFNHQNLSTNGLHPNFLSSLTIANLGHFYTEVIITPVIKAPSGGGYVPSFAGKPERYKVSVRVKINGIWSEDVKIVDDNQARVSARLYGITKFEEDSVMIAYNGVQIQENIVNIEVINNKRNTEF